ncbi:MAG: 50S ribosomal protein L1 [Thermoproteota archaeon]|jgi:large subunit ribosomal protein L1|uniref:Large ribosomal subunit protein uL1 n=1 Tax=Candidatus Methanodesulfokora washburnensis TaxID=2478471 RepID=A0A520KKP1_9CREN|nr:MAG: 50S ribosomal protein L1 [Candidatus Methanodesulfokores washburnensis]TDA41630.1 MAG: 50S ribosomal protein L1 [Candidatus Korarchaeota archaeon]
MELVEKIREVLEKSPKRRFNESVDLSIVLSGVDLKKNPNLKINEIVELENPPKNKDIKVCVFGTGEFAFRAKEAGADLVMDPEELKNMSKRELRKLANRYDHFIAQADALPKIAKIIGPVLGPRNKMPISLPVTAVDRLPTEIKRLKRSVRIRMRDQPYFSVKVGSRDMSAEEIAKNVDKIINLLKNKYGDLNMIKKAYIKTTMGPAFELPLR